MADSRRETMSGAAAAATSAPSVKLQSVALVARDGGPRLPATTADADPHEPTRNSSDCEATDGHHHRVTTVLTHQHDSV